MRIFTPVYSHNCSFDYIFIYLLIRLLIYSSFYIIFCLLPYSVLRVLSYFPHFYFRPCVMGGQRLFLFFQSLIQFLVLSIWSPNFFDASLSVLTNVYENMCIAIILLGRLHFNPMHWICKNHALAVKVRCH